MKRVNLAFETLGTAEARAAYDAQRAAAGKRKRERGGQRREHRRRARKDTTG